MTTEAPVLPDVSARGAAFLRRFTLLRTATLARAGRYDDAAESLPAGESRSAGELDLLARIRAQQGRLAEAEALWNEALAIAPGDERMTRALEHVRKHRAARIPLPALLMATAVTMIWLGITLLLQVPQDEQPPRAVSRSPVPPPAPPVALAVPGLRTHLDGPVLIAEFEQPPFEGAARLTAEARTALAAAAGQLRRMPGVHVIVCGQTDGVPVSRKSRYRDNEDLALARASAAAQHLVAGGLPASLCSIRASVDPAVSHVPAAGRRNVVLYVRRGKTGDGN